MRRFPQWVLSDQAPQQGARLAPSALCAFAVRSLLQSLKPTVLAGAPFILRPCLRASFQKGARIEGDGRLQSCGVAPHNGGIERDHIDVGAVQIQPQRMHGQGLKTLRLGSHPLFKQVERLSQIGP